MKRTTIMLPPELKDLAEKRARKLGVSMGELIRWSLGAFLERPEELGADDSFLCDDAVFEGEVPADLSEKHDDYLYGDEH